MVTDGALQALDYLYKRRGNYQNSGADGNPAVVLLDPKMPKVDGLEVLRIIKEDAIIEKRAGGDAHLIALRRRTSSGATASASTPSS